MSAATEIRQLNTLRNRAKKLRLKIVIVENNGRDAFGVGPTRIRDFDRYLERNYKRNEQDKCSVAVLRGLDEVEAFILSREML